VRIVESSKCVIEGVLTVLAVATYIYLLFNPKTGILTIKVSLAALALFIAYTFLRYIYARCRKPPETRREEILRAPVG
jgi:uncharacterized membrane protein HdeD (DUF308 family)